MATFLSDFVFFDEATSAGISNEWINSHADTFTLQVSGTATAFSATVEAQTDIALSASNGFIPVCLFNLSTGKKVENGLIEAKGRYAVVSEGVVKMRVRLTAVTGGNVTIFGKSANSAGV